MKLRSLSEGAVALVSGASSGIGAAVAAELVTRGARVIVAARRMKRLQELASRLGPRCMPIELDITDACSVTKLMERLPKSWQDIDILINNAGHDIGGKTRFDNGAISDWLSIIDTNLAGTIRLTYVVVPGMVERGGGQIVNIGSDLGRTAAPGAAAYSASKFAIDGFSKALRLDFLGRIRVMQVLPGVVRTEFDETRRRGDKAQAQAFYKSFAECLLPEDVADCVVFALDRPPRVAVTDILLLPSS